MKTNLLYLDDSYLKTMKAEILDVKEDGLNKWRVVLDQTVFYPMGGGQSTDQGILKASDREFQVYQVMMKEEEVWHYINSSVEPTRGMKVEGEINWDRRYKHMRLHSAGHIVDFALFLLGYAPDTLIPFKGDHGKKPYIIYQGIVDEDIRQKIEDKANELVQKNLEFSWLFQPYEELAKEAIYLQPGLPTNKPLRTLRLQSIGSVADGGTQVRCTNEVGKIIIPSIELKEGNTVVHYLIES